MKRLSPAQKVSLLKVLERRETRRVTRLSTAVQKSRERERRQQENAAHIAAIGARPARDAARVPILLPEDFSLRTNYAETVAVLERLRETVLLDRQPVTLYFDRVGRMGPSAALALTAEIYRCRNLRAYRNGIVVNGNYPHDRDLFFQLREMGFYRLIGVDGQEQVPDVRDRDGRPYYVPFRTFKGVDGEFAAGFCQMVLRGAFEMSDLTHRRMVEALKEAMGNADEHAYIDTTGLPVMSGRWWVVGYIDPGNREMMITLMDQGIGVPRSLGATNYEHISSLLTERTWQPSDGHMIAAATELHRTSTGQAGRGKGFRDMKQFVGACDDGELRILSNRGAYCYLKTGETITDEERSIGGTIIEWRVRHAERVEVRDG